MYKRKTYHFENCYEVEEYHNGRYGAPGEPRVKIRKATKEQIKKRNQYNKEKRLRRKLRKNFKKNDYWLTLTYTKDNRPEEMKKATKDVTSFLNKLRRYYKKQGQELKWVLHTEVGSRGGTHHHLVLNRIQDGDIAIRKCWVKGGVHIDLLYEEGGFKKLANYLAKVPDEKNKMKNSRYSCSRNLITPEPEVKIMKRKTWKEEPKPRKGYYLEKESYFEGINPVTRHKYRYYTMVRVRRIDDG